ncbi:MAG: hypothetical protein ACRYHA_32170 [Janthinobacterium lividum]
MVIRNPLSLQRFTAQSTSFREPVPAASATSAPWRIEIDRIGTAFKSLHRAAGQLQAQFPQSTLSLELDELEKKLAKVQKKISAGPFGGLVGEGPLARCGVRQRENAQTVTHILATLAEAATLVAADLESMAQGGADDIPDGAAWARLREQQRDIFRQLDDVKGCMPKEPTRFKLRTLAIVATVIVSMTGAIAGATLVAPILVIPLTAIAIGFAINAAIHLTQRRDTGWKALTQLIDQFSASSKELNYEALQDVVACLGKGIRTMRAENQASRDAVSQRLADLADTDRERDRMLTANAQHTARNDAHLQLLHQNIDDLKHMMLTIREEIDGADGRDGLAATIHHLGCLVASLRQPQEAADREGMPGMAMHAEVRAVETGIAPNVAAALRR